MKTLALDIPEINAPDMFLLTAETAKHQVCDWVASPQAPLRPCMAAP